MKHPLSLLIAAALLAACESKPVWDKPGASEAVAVEDAQSCHLKARVTPSTRPASPPSPYGGTIPVEEQRARFERDEFRNCMAEKGYSAKR
jgi:hypothetical protein